MYCAGAHAALRALAAPRHHRPPSRCLRPLGAMLRSVPASCAQGERAAPCRPATQAALPRAGGHARGRADEGRNLVRACGRWRVCATEARRPRWELSRWMWGCVVGEACRPAALRRAGPSLWTPMHLSSTARLIPAAAPRWSGKLPSGSLWTTSSGLRRQRARWGVGAGWSGACGEWRSKASRLWQVQAGSRRGRALGGGRRGSGQWAER